MFVVINKWKKFFPNRSSFLKKDEFDIIADIGCGDGEYLNRSINYFSNADYFVDISQKALNQCKKIKKSNKITFFSLTRLKRKLVKRIKKLKLRIKKF